LICHNISNCNARSLLITFSSMGASSPSAQLQEIRKVKLSRLVCDNGDHIDSAQVYVMVLPDPKL
jgi:hypothetical protein